MSRWDGYLAQLQVEMGLSEWTVQIEEAPAPDDCHAQIVCVDGRRIAKLELAHSFDKLPIDQQRHTLVHELLHVIEEESAQVLFKLRTHLGDPVFNIVWDQYVLRREYMVDHLADLIAPNMPPVPKELWA